MNQLGFAFTGVCFSAAVVVAACAQNDAPPAPNGGGSGGASGMSGQGSGGTTSGGAGVASAGAAGVASASGGSGGASPAAGAAAGGHAAAAGRAGTAGGSAGNGGTAARAGSGSSAAGAAGDSKAGTGGDTSGAGGGAGSGACVEATCGTHKWACWKMPTPGSSPASVPNHQHYTDLGDGAVRDDITCLVWEKANPATAGTWQQSFERCAMLAATSYAGFDDWRLPTRIEMASITDVTRGSKGYAEPFAVTSGYYDTGSYWYETITGQSTSNFHWAYGTNGYTSNAVVMTNTDNVARCVRGNGPGEAADELAVAPPDHYTLEGDAGSVEVTDNYTGLVWQQGFSPAIMAWEDAPAYCAALTLNGHSGFRVPTLNELATTVNEAKVGGAIDAAAFPGNPNGCKEPKYWFWAAEASKVGGTAWGLSYCDGFTGWNAGKSGDWNYFPEANVRCVR
jgi:hypothetical protein